MKFAWLCSHESYQPEELVQQAVAAEEAGFDAVLGSDHFHPWVDDTSAAGFVWSWLGAVAVQTNSVLLGTAVTAPLFHYHPALVAQMAATTDRLSDGRLLLGVGTGEALNEHVLGDQWPTAEVRLDMLAEAVAVIRELWKGETVDHDGEHYVVENARIYTLPSYTPDILVSAFGPKALTLAAEIADGFITTSPAADDIASYRRQGGRGRTQGGVKVCWHEDKQQAAKIAHSLWRTSGLPGQLAQDLPTPSHFDQASELVPLEKTAESVVCGNDPEEHAAALREYVDAGFDEVYVAQMGPDQEGMIAFYEREVLPLLR